MKVSIIVPVYNTEKYLSQCIDSLVNQTEKDQEIIMVNDGSTDTSGEICREYAAKFEHIIFLEQENKGQSSARNLALQHATGDYVLFVDSDDLLEPDAIRLFLEVATVTNVDIVHSKCTVCDDQANIISGGKKNRFVCIGTILSGIEYISKTLKDGCYDIVPVNNFVKREILQKNKIVFPEGLYMEDHLFTAQLFMNTKSITEIEMFFYRYRKHEGSTTNAINPRKIRNLILIMEKMLKYIDSFECSEEERKKLYPLITHSMGILIRFIHLLSLKETHTLYLDIDKRLLRIASKNRIGNRLANIQCRMFLFSPILERYVSKCIEIYFLHKKVRRN